MAEQYWDSHVCPGCNQTVGIGLMSLAATCACGMYYVDAIDYKGWYRSREAYRDGEGVLTTKETSDAR